MNNEPSLSLEQAQDRVEEKTAARVTKESIEKKIFRSTYLRHDTMTICIIEMENAFKVVGKAAPASRANFDALIGERYAYEDAFKQLWHLEGYLLCERLNGPPLAG